MNERCLRLSAFASVIALVSVGVWSLLQHQTALRSDRYAQRLQTWLALESQQSAELLRVRAGLTEHYDGIVQAAAARRRVLTALQPVPQLVDGPAQAELSRLLADAARERVSTEWQIERWKREHSVLNNSLRVLPRLAAELAPNVAALGIVRDALLLQHWHESSIDQRLLAGLALLDQTADNGLRVHATVVRERTALLNQLTDRIVQPSAAERAQRANEVFARELRAQAQRKQATNLWAVLLALLSAGLIAANIIVRLRRSGAALQNTSAELARVVESLRIEQSKQRELSELKTRFVSMTSHEFRTPLSVIISSAELLEAYGERWGTPKKLEHFTRIRSAAASMTRMLDAILMIGRSDAGALQAQAEEFEIGSFCADIVAYMAQADPSFERVVYHGPCEQTTVCADRALLRQVVENLLSNAVKYSPNGSLVLCEVECCAHELSLRIVDHGIGISSTDQGRLFETFQRGSNVGRIGGTGLGLAVVGRAVQLHGGSVSVRSDLGAGSEFIVRIPCVEGETWAEYSS